METPTEQTLETAKKFPWQWAVYLLCGVIIALFSYIVAGNRSDKLEAAELRHKYDSLQQDNVLYLRSAIKANAELETRKKLDKSKDSVFREKVVEPAKQLITDGKNQ
jgi:hypothetical protein